MLTLILLPLYLSYEITSDLFIPEHDPPVFGDPFTFTREELESAEPTQFWLFGVPLDDHIETGDNVHNGHFINMVSARQRFPNVLSCMEDHERASLVDITQLDTNEFHQRSDLEICAWHVATFLETQEQLGPWLEAVGFDISSYRVSDFKFRQRHEGTRWIEAHWSEAAKWTSIPMSRSFRWRHFGFYGFGLQFVRAADGQLLQVKLAISYL